jgi:hypothetical protein
MCSEFCDTCRFWKQISNTSEGRCVFNPPSIIPVLRIDKDEECLSDDMVSAVTRFPIVNCDEWCGQWEQVAGVSE